MATKKSRKIPSSSAASDRASSTVEELLLAALERGDDSFETGRFLVTFKEGAAEAGLQSLGAQGMRVADARDYKDQAATLESVGDADAEGHGARHVEGRGDERGALLQRNGPGCDERRFPGRQPGGCERDPLTQIRGVDDVQFS